MTSILVGGKFLDLPEGFSVELVKKNILFAFDDIECERTTSFEVPSTPNNESIFALAGVVAADGLNMRAHINAELRVGAVSQSGYMYLNSYDPASRKYSACFITGELLPLVDIRNAGKISEYLTGDFGTTRLTDGSITYGVLLSPFIAYQTKLASINYRDLNTERNWYRPSMQVKQLIDACATYFGCTVNYPALAAGWICLRVLLDGSFSAIPTITGAQLKSIDSSSGQWINTTYPALACPNGTIFTDATIELLRQFAGTSDIYKVRAYKANQHIKITFAAGTNPNYVLIDDSVQQQYSGYVIASNLAGQTVDIPSGTVFAMIDPTKQWALPNHGYTSDAFETLATITLEGADSPKLGDIIRGQDNLPDVTFIELLKIMAAITGTVLTYDAATNVFSFDTLASGGTSTRELTAITKRGKVERKFSNYQQANYVQYNSADEVQANERIRVEYDINNINLETSKELFNIPFSEGRPYSPPLDNSVAVTASSSPTLCYALNDISYYYLQRVGLGKNSPLQLLCDASTTYELEVDMSALEFATLTPKTLLLVENLLFWWTDARWSEGKSTLSLSKIYYT